MRRVARPGRRFFEKFTRGVENPVERRRVHLLVAISLLGIGFLVAFGLLAVQQQARALAVADFTMAALLAANLRLVAGHRRYRISIVFGITACGVLYLYFLATGGVGGSAILWWYTYPLIAAFLLGSRWGLAGALTLAATAVAYFAVGPEGDSWASYPQDFQPRFVASYLLVCVLSFLFEFSRERTQQELHKAKEQAEQASLTKSRLMASMSHELRTPLNAVIGFSEVLEAEYFGRLNEKQREYVRDIHLAGQHLLKLIGEVLDLSKIEAGKMEIERQPVDLKELLAESLVMVRERAGARGIALNLSVPEAPVVPVEGDSLRLRQVVYNLLSNAVKFTPAGGSVSVELFDRNGGDVVVSVADSGIGIAPGELGRIFEEFYQTSAEAQDKTPGTGLGLALARNIVELHGGSIWAESDGPGRGSRFSFRLSRDRT